MNNLVCSVFSEANKNKIYYSFDFMLVIPFSLNFEKKLFCETHYLYNIYLYHYITILFVYISKYCMW